MARLEINFAEGVRGDPYESFDVTAAEGAKVLDELKKSNDGVTHSAFTFRTSGAEGDGTASTVYVAAGSVAWAELDDEKPDEES